MSCSTPRRACADPLAHPQQSGETARPVGNDRWRDLDQQRNEGGSAFEKRIGVKNEEFGDKIPQ